MFLLMVLMTDSHSIKFGRQQAVNASEQIAVYTTFKSFFIEETVLVALDDCVNVLRN